MSLFPPKFSILARLCFRFIPVTPIVESNHLINLSSEQILIMFYSKENSWTNTSDKEYLTTKDTFKERDKPGYKP